MKIGTIYTVGTSNYCLKDVGERYVWLMDISNGKIRPMLITEFNMNKIERQRINFVRRILLMLNMLVISDE